MKVLKYLIITLAVLFIAFLMIGVLVPQISYENKISINAPREKVFSIFMDGSQMGKWMDLLK